MEGGQDTKDLCEKCNVGWDLVHLIHHSPMLYALVTGWLRCIYIYTLFLKFSREIIPIFTYYFSFITFFKKGSRANQAIPKIKFTSY